MENNKYSFIQFLLQYRVLETIMRMHTHIVIRTYCTNIRCAQKQLLTERQKTY